MADRKHVHLFRQHATFSYLSRSVLVLHDRLSSLKKDELYACTYRQMNIHGWMVIQSTISYVLRPPVRVFAVNGVMKTHAASRPRRTLKRGLFAGVPAAIALRFTRGSGLRLVLFR